MVLLDGSVNELVRGNRLSHVEGVSFSWQNVCYSIEEHKILKGCSGHLSQGNFLGEFFVGHL